MVELRNSNAAVTSTGMFRAGWVLTGLVGAFLIVDGGARLAGVAPYGSCFRSCLESCRGWDSICAMRVWVHSCRSRDDARHGSECYTIGTLRLTARSL
jgi:hypothetical protein